MRVRQQRDDARVGAELFNDMREASTPQGVERTRR